MKKEDQILESVSMLYDLLMQVQDDLSKLLNNKRQEKTTLHNDLKKTFLDYYRNLFNDEYYWMPKDSVAIHQIITKIEFKTKAKSGTDPTVVEIAGTFKILLLGIKDDWIITNLSVALINSKFNQIVQQHGKKGHPNKYDKKYEQTLQGNEIMEYHGHLLKLGYKKFQTPTGTAWQKPNKNTHLLQN